MALSFTRHRGHPRLPRGALRVFRDGVVPEVIFILLIMESDQQIVHFLNWSQRLLHAGVPVRLIHETLTQ